MQCFFVFLNMNSLRHYSESPCIQMGVYLKRLRLFFRSTLIVDGLLGWKQGWRSDTQKKGWKNGDDRIELFSACSVFSVGRSIHGTCAPIGGGRIGNSQYPTCHVKTLDDLEGCKTFAPVFGTERMLAIVQRV